MILWIRKRKIPDNLTDCMAWMLMRCDANTEFSKLDISSAVARWCGRAEPVHYHLQTGFMQPRFSKENIPTQSAWS